MTKIAVIGGGPGGYVAAIRAAQLGAEVTLVERERLGGTCLNVGCIPTKALLHSAALLRAAKAGAKQGIRCEPSVDFSAVQQHKQAVCEKLVRGVGGLLKVNKVQVLQGTAAFTSPYELRVEGKGGVQTLTADKFIVASGSAPVLPRIPGANGPHCIDSTGALSLDAVPKSMVIIGGGVIGVELATAYAAFGTAVTIVELLPQILPMVDGELARLLLRSLKKQGVAVVTGARVTGITHGQDAARVAVEQNGAVKEYAGEKVLLCIGRRANTDGLGLTHAGVKMDERGRIQADAHLRTNVPHIYAIGDCLGKTMLAHVASAQGEAAAENCLGHAAVCDEATNPSCVYTDPEIACVGLTEEEANARGIPCVVGKFPLAANGKALIENGGEGMVKIVAGSKYRQVLGVHIIGPRATDLITEGALAIRLEATLEELVSTIHAHPTMGEAVREAALHAMGRAIHCMN